MPKKKKICLPDESGKVLSEVQGSTQSTVDIFNTDDLGAGIG